MTGVNIKDTGGYLLASEQGVKAVFSGVEVDVLSSMSKQSIARDWPTVLAGYENPQSLQSVDNRMGSDSSNQYVDGWLSLIREQLYSNPSVEDIFVSIEGNDVDVWVVIPERDLAILHQIVEAEGELFNTLVSGENSPFLMDFHIIYRCGRNIEDLAPTKAIRLPR